MKESDSPRNNLENCKYSAIDMALYLLHKMTPEAEAEFKTHLSHCKACQKKVAEIKRGAKNIKKEFQEEQKEHPGKHRFLYLVIAAAVILLALGSYWLIVENHRSASIQLPEKYLHTDTLHTKTDTVIPPAIGK